MHVILYCHLKLDNATFIKRKINKNKNKLVSGWCGLWLNCRGGVQRADRNTAGVTYGDKLSDQLGTCKKR